MSRNSGCRVMSNATARNLLRGLISLNPTHLSRTFGLINKNYARIQKINVPTSTTVPETF